MLIRLVSKNYNESERFINLVQITTMYLYEQENETMVNMELAGHFSFNCSKTKKKKELLMLVL